MWVRLKRQFSALPQGVGTTGPVRRTLHLITGVNRSREVEAALLVSIVGVRTSPETSRVTGAQDV